MSEERTRAIVFLRRLPHRILRDFARRYRRRFRLRVSASRQTLIQQIVERVPIDFIEELYGQYEDAGNVTIFLYKFGGGRLGTIRTIQDLRKVLLRANMISKFRRQEKIQPGPRPQPVLFDMLTTGGRRLKTRFEFVGQPIAYRDPETRELKSVSPLRTVVSVFHLSSGLLEARTRDRVVGTSVVRTLARSFGGRYRKLAFSREDLEQWVEWAKTLRNARFRPLTGVLSTLWLTARRELDLREEKTFLDWWSRGEPVSGIYVQFEHRPHQVVGFGINARLGSLFFRSFASEDVINLVIAKAERILAT